MPLNPQWNAARKRSSRRVEVTVGKFVFVCRRPTEHDVIDMHTRNALTDVFAFAVEFVIDWKGVTSADVFPDEPGDATALEFDAELWREWVAERPDFWTPIAEACSNAYVAYRDKVQGAVGE